MKKLVLLFITFNILSNSSAQTIVPKTTTFKFETIYYDAIYKWVVFPKSQADTSYVYGFLYLDMQAGFTFNQEGTFHIDELGKLVSSVKVPFNTISKRLSNTTSNVAVLTAVQLKELGVPGVPLWLKNYKKPIDDAESLTKIGQQLNKVGGNKKALEFLLKAYKKTPHHKGLEYELGYAYNALGQYEKAIEILNAATTFDPKNALLYKEFGYAYLNLHKLVEAEAIYKRGVTIATDKELKNEMAINMINYYYIQKSKDKFEEWKAIIKENASPDSQYIKYIEHFEKEWNTKK
ncbi:tetratricopeptide repeat protein [Flavobacterium sp.]|uniref:tetratricopeptide repeat protein n=1 Tax=Flavobacterium sp. TaxID=239 RepID=UPI00261E7CD2|nr:tetratricopeptide repeat protein [Flavobacterium sp.]